MYSLLQGEVLEKLIHDCVEWYELQSSSQKTTKELRYFLGRFTRWLDGRELTVKECRIYVKYLQQKGMARTTISGETSRLKMFLKWIHQEADATETDWSPQIRRPKDKREQQKPEMLLSPAKIIEYIYAVTEPGAHDHVLHRVTKQEHREFLLFYCRSGLRPNEAIKIQPENVNLDGPEPSVQLRRKGGKWKTLGLPLDYLEPIRKRVEKGEWFKVSQFTLQGYMRKISKLAGRRIVLYSIRKMVDTGLLDAGAPIMQAAEQQGHTVAIMQAHYYKYSAKESSELANTYNPFIDRSKLDVQYMLPRIDKLAKECRQHPGIKVDRGERRLVIEW